MALFANVEMRAVGLGSIPSVPKMFLLLQLLLALFLYFRLFHLNLQ